MKKLVTLLKEAMQMHNIDQALNQMLIDIKKSFEEEKYQEFMQSSWNEFSYNASMYQYNSEIVQSFNAALKPYPDKKWNMDMRVSHIEVVLINSRKRHRPEVTGGASSAGGIIIEVPIVFGSEDQTDFKTIKEDIAEILQHELQHLDQLTFKKKETKQDMWGYDIEDGKMEPDDEYYAKDKGAYYSKKREIQAYASSIVERFKQKGFSKQEMIDQIKTNKDSYTTHMVSLIKGEQKDKPALIQYFYKNIANYINSL